MNTPIFVTQPSLAPLPEFVAYLEEIWKTGVMTHNGPMLQRLEREIAALEGLPDAVCVANGTCAMQLAIRALDLDGEIITTPFTFIATANSIAWERCTPVFVDIDPGTWNIDPAAIEAAITPRTSGILPVHVFSAPCDVVRIEEIAARRGLKVIYDAAHAMCVRVGGRSIMSYGDVSCTSFHATKLFNTCEGGACFAGDAGLMARLRRMRFFGFDERKDIVDDGMNAKMTEIAAALGLANLPHIEAVCAARRRRHAWYRERLGRCPHLAFQAFKPDEYNYSYFPVLLDTVERLLRTERALNAAGIFPRRYFHPALHQIRRFAPGARLPVAERVAGTVLCLPMYTDLAVDDIDRICAIVGG
jgi:dTDP-4-amino-4,6-dideoxygalactose transaminase